MTTDSPKNAPKDVANFDGPTLVRYQDATRFLWGDDQSRKVADIIYGRNETIASMVYKLRPGACFKASDSWKTLFTQHRFYYVLRGEVAVHDPETGEVAVARAGEAVSWHGEKWHFAYNLSSEECCVLDWYAPMERPAHVTELEFATTKPSLGSEKGGRFELLGNWPDGAPEARSKTLNEGGMSTVTKSNALHFVHGDQHPIMESLFASSQHLTAGSVDLIPGARSDDRSHPCDKVIFTTKGTLHVYLPETFDWFELNEWDLLYVPQNTPHQYWNYSGKHVSFMFLVVPTYA